MTRIALIAALVWWSAAWPAPSAAPLGQTLSMFAEACLSDGPKFPNAQRFFEKRFDFRPEEDVIVVREDLVSQTFVWRDEEALLAAAFKDFPAVRRCELDFHYNDRGAVWFSANKMLTRRFGEKFDIIVSINGPIFRIDAYEQPIFVEIWELSVNTGWEGMMGLSAIANKE